MAESTYREYLLDYDSFNKPKILTDQQAIACLLTRLILLEPGTNPLMPEMGVGIVSKYRYLGADQEKNLTRDITNQINTFLPEATCTNVELIYNNDKSVDIEITVDGTIFVYQSSKLAPITLDDMKQ
jgi:hypothetical protein